MSPGEHFVSSLLAIAALAPTSRPATAMQVTVPITTVADAVDWTITAQGLKGPAQQTIPFPENISISSNGDSTGTLFNDAFNNQTWGGVWAASYHFALPADSTAVSLEIDTLAADDKVMVALNGRIVRGATYVNGNSTGWGVFNFGDGSVPWRFPGFDAPVVTSQNFIVGGLNTLTLYVNNTGSTAPGAVNKRLIPGVDGTAVFFASELTYQSAAGSMPISAVPEPSAIALMGLGLSGIAVAIGRRSALQA